LANKVGRLLGREAEPENLGEYWMLNADAKALESDHHSDLARIFFQNQGRVIHKWLHYFEIYEQYFSRYRGSDFKMLEIGVSKGGSLAMWRSYFGPRATIYGIDVNPDSTPPTRSGSGPRTIPTSSGGSWRRWGASTSSLTTVRTWRGISR
jgi:hypothetical protein